MRENVIQIIIKICVIRSLNTLLCRTLNKKKLKCRYFTFQKDHSVSSENSNCLNVN